MPNNLSSAVDADAMNREAVPAHVAARPPQILSLCSGIGGLDLGLHAALRGHCRTVCMVEREGFAAAILAQRMQDGWLDDAPVWSDLATFDAGPWRGAVDGVVGSYPCQSLSNAGRRRGTSDERWLWPHFARIIADAEPSWCFFENVAQHVNVGLDLVWGDLRGMGFEVEAGLFEAAEVGAVHIRRRLFILAVAGGCRPASSADNGEGRHVADAAGERLCGGPRDLSEADHRAGEAELPRGADHRIGGQDVANALGEHGRRRVVGASAREVSGAPGKAGAQAAGAAAGGGKNVADPNHQGRLQQDRTDRPERRWPAHGGRKSDATDWRSKWRSSAGIRRVAHGVPARVDRLRALGNAVVPACAAHAFETLVQQSRERDQAHAQS